MPRRAPEEWIVRPVLGNPVSCPASRTSRPDRGGGAQRALHLGWRVGRAPRRARASSASRAVPRASARVSWRRDRASRGRVPEGADRANPGASIRGRELPPCAVRLAASRRERPRPRHRCGGDACRWWTPRPRAHCRGARRHPCRGAPRARRRPHRGDMGAPASVRGPVMRWPRPRN